LAWEEALREQFEIDTVADREFLDWLWEDLSRDFAHELEGGGSEVLSGLVAAAERPCVTIVRFTRGDGGIGQRHGSVAKPNLGESIGFDPKTKAHVLALSEYLSKVASVERQVMEFRRRHLGGPATTVAPSEVPRLLESWSVSPGSESEDDVYLHWTGGEYPVRFRGTFWSALGTLDRLGDYLAKRYPWNKDQAMHLVLCGGKHQVKTVSGKRGRSFNLGPAAHSFHRGTVTLEVEAWMPPELVKRAYARMQREVPKDDVVLGGAVGIRRAHGRYAEVFRFVLGRSEIKVVSEKENLGKLVIPDTWRRLRELWDKNLPAGHSWRYGADRVQNFRRDFMRGQENVTGSRWGLLGVPGQPRTAEQALRAVDEMVERWGGEREAK
jgi:hypothetical protein